MNTGSTNLGIASLGLKLPSRYLDVRDLAALRGVDPDKFTKGLGCHEIALCGEGESVVTLAAGAAKRALARWGGSPKDLGLLVVGTETAQDMSRPLSAFVADELGLRGAIRSYETKHACYGGTVALRQALEWKASGASRGKAALVIASDVALYAPKDPGEPTQGAAAVVIVVDDASVAAIDLESYAWAEPAFDFWRPVGESFPRVDGPLSLECYEKATTECFRQLADGKPLDEVLAAFSAVCFHVPFPKMVKKAVMKLGEANGWSEGVTSALFESKVMPAMDWNRHTGNSYTAALWTGVAKVLAGAEQGARFAAFSYGSGFGSELLTMTAGPKAKEGAWKADVAQDLASRTRIDAETYLAYRGA